MNGHRKAVVTGLGVLSAAGVGREVFWSALRAGRSAIGPLTRVDASRYPSKVAGEVRDFHPRALLGPTFRPRRHARSSQLAAGAMRLALDDAGLDREHLAIAAPIGVFFGISLAGFDIIQRELGYFFSKGPERMTAGGVMAVPLAAAALASEALGVPCRLMNISNTCVGGLDALALGAKAITRGEHDLVFAGGADAPLVDTLFGGFCAAQMLCTLNDDPARASRPFDVGHERGVLAEGAACLVVESDLHAAARGARPLMTIEAWGQAKDPTPEPLSGLSEAITLALQNGGLVPEDLTAIWAHGPSDREIDRAEVLALKHALGPHAYRLPVMSVKGVTGNPLAAGGSMQALAAALAFEGGIMPPTANLEQPDPDCDLDFVMGAPRVMALDRILINAHGMGGVNTAMVVRRARSA
jgi:3-oxoacyl-[acyl-carrier-protein] synthase II